MTFRLGERKLFAALMEVPSSVGTVYEKTLWVSHTLLSLARRFGVLEVFAELGTIGAAGSLYLHGGAESD